MKLIVAIVRPFTVDKILTAFEEIEGFPGMTVTDSEGFGRRFRSTRYDPTDPFKQGKRIEIAANDEMVPNIIAAIRENAHTGKMGDGLITVATAEMSVRI